MEEQEKQELEEEIRKAVDDILKTTIKNPDKITEAVVRVLKNWSMLD